MDRGTIHKVIIIGSGPAGYTAALYAGRANLAPLMIGLVVVAIGMSFGGMHGYAINPARDFGPRLFTAVAGFRNNGLSNGPRVWWVPVAAPLLGGLVGGAVYDLGIRRFLRAEKSAL